MSEPDTNAADIIIFNGTVLPMGGGKTIQNGALKIIGDTITELGSANNFDISGRAKSA